MAQLDLKLDKICDPSATKYKQKSDVIFIFHTWRIL